MAYEPTVWKDRVVERPRTYQIQDNGDGTVTLIPAPGQILEPGTPVNAANLNKLEQGLKTHEADSVAHGVATQSEAEAGTSNAKYMTPLRVKQAFAVFNNSKVTGVTTLTGDVYRNTPLIKQIPIPSGKTRGRIIVTNNHGMVIEFDTDPRNTFAFGSGRYSNAYTYSTVSRRLSSTLFDAGYDSGFGYRVFGSIRHGEHRYYFIGVDDVYISGSNIIIVFTSSYYSSTPIPLDVTLHWEVW